MELGNFRRRRHLYSPGQPSHRASAHILVWNWNLYFWKWWFTTDHTPPVCRRQFLCNACVTYHVNVFIHSLLWPPCIADTDIIFLSCSLLWPPYGIGQAIIFSCCDFYLSIYRSSFFVPWSQRPHIGCLTYFDTWCSLSANLECMSEMCCTRLAENTGRKKSPNETFRMSIF